MQSFPIDQTDPSASLWSVIEGPTLLLDRARAVINIQRMAAKARASGVRFRPHFKTHQSAEVGRWFHDAGVRHITVSSVDMAAYFADHGWDDITVAFPVNLRQLRRIDELASRVQLGLVVENVEAVDALVNQLAHKVDIWIKIDTGYGRTGIAWSATARIAELADLVADHPGLRLRGLLCHAGHSYAARGTAAVEAVYRETVERMNLLRRQLTAAGLRELEVSIGDTPGCSVVEQFADVDEVRPGNFVFYDLTQLAIGACREQDIAVAVACPVVAKHPERGTLVVYGGAVHLSKDVLPLPNGKPCYGRVALPQAAGWGPLLDDMYVSSVSQEHGIVSAPAHVIDEVKIGNLLVIVPVHSCLTADMLKRYLTLDGERVSMLAAPA